MATDWQFYVLQTVPGREFAARAGLIDPFLLRERGLSEDDLHVLLPLRHTLTRPAPRRSSDRRIRRSLVARPRIPGYLLMGIQPFAKAVWGHVLGVPYVVGVLGHGGEPQPVSDQQLLVAMLEDLKTLMRPRRRNKGRTVPIINGPYADREVGVVEINNADPEIFNLFGGA